MKVMPQKSYKNARKPNLQNGNNNTRILNCPQFSPVCIIDSGTDIAVLGKGWLVIKHHDQKMNMNGKLLPLVDAVSSVCDPTQPKKHVCLVKVCQALYDPDERESLLPPAQLEWFGLKVSMTPIIRGGDQKIYTEKGSIELFFDGKLTWFPISTPLKKDHELTLHVLTSSDKYEPEKLARAHAQSFSPTGKHLDTEEESLPEQKEPKPSLENHLTLDYSLEDNDMNPMKFSRRRYVWNPIKHLWKPHQLVEWRRRLCAFDDEVVKNTFLCTTQLVPSVQQENQAYPKDHHVARFPILAHRRLNETVYADPVEFLADGSTQYALFISCKVSKLRTIYPLGRKKSSTKMLDALYDFVREFGVPRTLYSDYGADCNISDAWKRFSRLLVVPQHNSEAHHHESNFVERSWQEVKQRGFNVMRENVIPNKHTFSIYQHICDCMNHTAINSNDNRTPLEILTGDTPDISVFRFRPYQEVWYLKTKATLDQREWIKGRFLGIAWSTGDSMCFRVVPEDKHQRIIHRTTVLPRHKDEKVPRQIYNHPSDYFFPTPVPDANQDQKMLSETGKHLRGVADDTDTHEDQHKAGKTSVEDRPQVRKPLSKVSTRKKDTSDDEPERTNFDNATSGPIEDALRKAYLDMAAKEEDILNELSRPPPDLLDAADVSRILRYRYKGGDIYFKCQTAQGQDVWCDIDDLKTDCPVTLAKYILDHKSLKNDAVLSKWAKACKDKADRATTLIQAAVRNEGIQQGIQDHGQVSCRRRSSENSPAARNFSPKKKKLSRNRRPKDESSDFLYGVKVPRSTEQALQLDKDNGNTLWADAIRKELGTIWKMGTFKKIGRQSHGEIRRTHQFAPLRMIFTVKSDLRRKARLVIGGHVVNAQEHELYASTMKGISARLLMLVASANKLDVLCGDIQAAYLYASNNLKTYVRLGKEFNVMDDTIDEGTFATVEQALYGLPTSANRWHQHLAESLRRLGFEPTRYDQDVWYIKRKDTKNPGYDYIGTHTDDLMIVAQDPSKYMVELQKVYTINNIGPPSHHLGCDYEKLPDGRWTIGTTTYVKEALQKAKTVLGKPGIHKHNTPMLENLKPEIDTSDFLNPEGHRKYQQLIGIAQWLITCGRLDILQAINSLSRFSAAPREKHLCHLERVFGYLEKYPKRSVIVDPSPHVPSGTVDKPYTTKDETQWKDIYPGACEELDPKFPIPLGQPITTGIYFDSNHAHDEVNRRSITGLLTYAGGTPISWVSKRQGAIATSTYTAEMAAAKTAAEEAISIRYMLRSLGVPVEGRTYLWGDNLGSLMSTDNPGAQCKKKHSQVAFHYVRECNAAGITDVRKVHTDFNLSDPFTKPLGRIAFDRAFNRIYGLRKPALDHAVRLDKGRKTNPKAKSRSTR
jgi:Reverse transcriptase (RNA-dependent DNA polymerase)